LRIEKNEYTIRFFCWVYNLEGVKIMQPLEEAIVYFRVFIKLTDIFKINSKTDQ